MGTGPGSWVAPGRLRSAPSRRGSHRPRSRPTHRVLCAVSCGMEPKTRSSPHHRPIMHDDASLAGLQDALRTCLVEHPIGDAQTDAGHRRQLLLADRYLGIGPALVVHITAPPQLTVAARRAV